MADDRDRLDDLLDAALEARGRIEPRPGLETRILATLRERPPLPVRRALLARPGGRLALAAAAAVVLAVAVVVATSGGRPAEAPPIASATTAAPRALATPPPVASPAAVSAASPASGPSPVATRRDVTSRPAVRRASRRPSFPAPSPLSEEERLLLRFVSDAPRAEVEGRVGFLDEPAALPPLPDSTTNS